MKKKKKLKIKNFANIKESIKKKVKESGKKKVILNSILVLLIAIASLFLIFALYIIISSPSFDKDLLYTKEATVIYDKNGTEIARIGNENRALITYDELPQVFVDALLATEDSRFFQHNGLDIARFLKASAQQLIGQGAGGASTITMQLIKNVYTKGQKKENKLQSFVRKFQDIYMAVFKVENSYTKEEILEFYVNTLWLGNDGNINYSGIYGVEQGSQFYFGKSISDLTLAEASLLVGMYQNPTLYNPFKNSEGCRNRQRTVLKLMVHHGYITEDEMNAVLEIPIESLLTDKKTTVKSNTYQAIIDYVLNEVEEKTGVNPYSTPMKIYSTYDLKVQDVLVKMENGEYYKFLNDYDQEGVAITSTVDGSIVALSGGRNYVAKGLNRAADINRRPGSTAKPFFDYGPFFEYLNGSTGDYLFDETYKYSNGTVIKNANGKNRGILTVREALSNSLNIPALQAFQKVAAEDPSIISDYVHSFGIDYGNQLYESASIGGFNGMSPLQMSAAYAVYGRGGYYIEPYSFTKIVYEDGTTFDYKYTKKQVVSAQTSYMITSVLMDVISKGSCGNVSVKGTQVAGKTGTTDVDDNSLKKLGIPLGATEDAWDATYTSEYSIALWYGYDNLSKDHYLTSSIGIKARKALMSGIAKHVYSTNKTFKVPSGVVWKEVEKETIPLQLPSKYTPSDMIVKELFKTGTEPTEVSQRYAKVDTPTGGSVTYSGNVAKLTWNAVKEPEMMVNSNLQDYFNTNYGTFSSKYYERRLQYNSSQIGTLGYQIYLDNGNGNLTYITRVTSPSYSQTIEPNKEYRFVIKAAYSIYTNTASDGLEIKASIVSTPQENVTEENTEA